MGIGKTHLPYNSHQSVGGDYRVGHFNSVDLTFVYGKRTKAACGVAADYRRSFKVIVGVVFFKLQKFAELFVFALYAFIFHKLFVRFLKLPAQLLVFKINFFCAHKAVKKAVDGIAYIAAQFKKGLRNNRKRLRNKHIRVAHGGRAHH